MENKTRLITPTLMLIAAAVASITMFIKDYELYTMLWVLLVVLIVFYIIGDVARYIYASVRPCILPQSSELETMIAGINAQEEEDEVVEVEDDSSEESDTAFTQETDEQENDEDSQENEGYEDFGESYEDYNEEYTDENLDEM